MWINQRKFNFILFANAKIQDCYFCVKSQGVYRSATEVIVILIEFEKPYKNDCTAAVKEIMKFWKSYEFPYFEIDKY